MSQEREWNCEDPKKRLEWAEATTEARRVLEGKWKIVIICQLFAAKGPLRFSDLEKLIDGINQKMLIQRTLHALPAMFQFCGMRSNTSETSSVREITQAVARLSRWNQPLRFTRFTGIAASARSSISPPLRPAFTFCAATASLMTRRFALSL